MREFLQRHCDCHPLVTGIVAGLVSHYLPNRGNFDAWAADPTTAAGSTWAGWTWCRKQPHPARRACRAAGPGRAAAVHTGLAVRGDRLHHPDRAQPAPAPRTRPRRRAPRPHHQSLVEQRLKGRASLGTARLRAAVGAPPRLPAGGAGVADLPAGRRRARPPGRHGRGSGVTRCCSTTRRPAVTTCTRSCRPPSSAGWGARSCNSSSSGWPTTSPPAPPAARLLRILTAPRPAGPRRPRRQDVDRAPHRAAAFSLS